MTYRLINQIEQLPHVGLTNPDTVLTDCTHIALTDEQLELVESIVDRASEIYSENGYLPQPVEKNLLGTHGITIRPYRHHRTGGCMRIKTPFGQIDY